MKKYIFILLFICISGAVYAQRKVVEVETEPTSQSETARMLKRKVAIGRFSNETQYAKGLFYDKENDPMGKQALDILSTRLAASDKFILLERNDISQLLDEASSTENGFQKIGADYMIIGSII